MSGEQKENFIRRMFSRENMKVCWQKTRVFLGWLDRVLMFRVGMAALWKLFFLYLENRRRRRRLDALDRECSASFLALALQEENKSGTSAQAEREALAQAAKLFASTRGVKEAAEKRMEDLVRLVKNAQSLQEKKLAVELADYKSAMELLRADYDNTAIWDRAAEILRDVCSVRRAWRTDFAGMRGEGIALESDVKKARQDFAAAEKALGEARRKFGAALFAAGETGPQTENSARLKNLAADTARLETEQKEAVQVMLGLARTARRAAILIAVILVLSIGGTISIRSWRSAVLTREIEKIRGTIGRPDREKSKVEKEADREIEDDDLRIVD